jgi:hypothetical protein
LPKAGPGAGHHELGELGAEVEHRREVLDVATGEWIDHDAERDRGRDGPRGIPSRLGVDDILGDEQPAQREFHQDLRETG